MHALYNIPAGLKKSGGTGMLGRWNWKKDKEDGFTKSASRMWYVTFDVNCPECSHKCEVDKSCPICHGTTKVNSDQYLVSEEDLRHCGIEGEYARFQHDKNSELLGNVSMTNLEFEGNDDQYIPKYGELYRHCRPDGKSCSSGWRWIKFEKTRCIYC